MLRDPFDALDDPEPLLRRSMALFSLFAAHQQASICTFASRFYDHKRVYAHPNLVCTAELLALVAGHAALVGGAQATGCFASVKWIYFCADDLDDDGDALGASTVRLNAAVCLQESQQIIPGQNLVVHEFAHVLDHQLGISGSTPALREVYRKQVAEFDQVGHAPLIPSAWMGGDEIFEPAGGLTEGEFFACLSESFFTEPQSLLELDRALYDDLVAIYGLDMASLLPR